MRRYDSNGKLSHIHCNKCCRTINLNIRADYLIPHVTSANELMKQEFIESDKTFEAGGIYQDLQIKFDLCDECYHELTQSFKIPAEFIYLDSHDKDMELFCSYYGVITILSIEHNSRKGDGFD